MGYRPPSDVDPVVKALIKHKARRLVGRHGFSRSDREDLEQELALQVHLAKAKYDPKRGTPATFYKTVLSNKIKSIVSAAKAQKRDHRRNRPLRDLDDVIWHPDAIPPLQRRLDVDAALDSLPPDVRRIATLFVDDGVVGVERNTGLTRGKVRSARSRMARHFAAQGLKE
jgi:RNA polymerase sigma-70 factor (ECF subfamily)